MRYAIMFYRQGGVMGKPLMLQSGDGGKGNDTCRRCALDYEHSTGVYKYNNNNSPSTT